MTQLQQHPRPTAENSRCQGTGMQFPLLEKAASTPEHTLPGQGLKLKSFPGVTDTSVLSSIVVLFVCLLSA